MKNLSTDEDSCLKSLGKKMDEYEEKPTNEKILEGLFRLWNGMLFSNKEMKHGIGVYPDPHGFIVEFFKIMDDGRFKYIDRRAINVNDFSKEVIIHALNVCEIMNKKINKEGENNHIDYHG